MKKWKFQSLTGISALIVSILTLIGFTYEIQITRKQQYASVLPYLQVRNLEMYTPNYKLSIINDGLGPAFIKSIKVIDDGTEYIGDPQAYLAAKNLNITDSLVYTYSTIYTDRLIPPGKQIDMITAVGDDDNALRLSNIFVREGLNIQIEFESVFGERWILSHQKVQKIN
jgi:energy-converting hydrogenase Eha subunit F